MSNILMVTTSLSKHVTVKKLVQINQCNLFVLINKLWARGDAGTTLRAGKVGDSIPDGAIRIFH